VPNAPQSVQAERATVPDACTVVGARLASELVPNADKTNMRSPDTSDRHTECAWTGYAETRSRQLGVELRAIQAAGGLSATTAAEQSLAAERQADSAGKGLLPTQRVVARRTVTGLGDEAYAIYASDKSQALGEAILNVRLGNVLVTVHYVGGDRRTPLQDKRVTAGATAVVRQALRTMAG
jgi:hypothetical protein